MNEATTLTTEQALQLALQAHQAGRFEEAETIYRQILAADGKCVGALNNLATLLHRRGQIDDAILCYQRALALVPESAEVHFNLGDALRSLGRLDEAMAHLRLALALNPNDAATHHHLGVALHGVGEIRAAAECYAKAVALKPAYADAQHSLGAALAALGELDEAMAALRTALSLRPDFAEAHHSLANALKEAGRLPEAIAQYRKALALKPGFQLAHSFLLYALYLDPRYSPAEILAEHRKWERQHAGQWMGKPARHDNDRSPERRLRVGYVSADFCRHVITRFLPEIFENHDRERFEIVCFSGVTREDQFTARFRACADEWHTVAAMSDDALAELIRRQRIDILVDLSLHLADNRLLVFARKPAPLQVTCVAYPGTSGLSAMDYRFTEANLDPPGSDAHYAERSLRLRSYWCFKPWEVNAALAPPPSIANRFVTFGCLNHFSKVSDAALRTWAQVLHATPRSRLILHAPPGSHRQRVTDAMTAAGIDAARVELVGKKPFEEYYQAYNRIDIALDPFPCAGGTTSCDAMWMGVPLVTLAGATALGRSGVSLLSRLGLTELIATCDQEYVATAAALAVDSEKRVKLRTTLRERMVASLCDARNVTRDVEAQYRWMWRQWCASRVNDAAVF